MTALLWFCRGLVAGLLLVGLVFIVGLLCTLLGRACARRGGDR